MAKERKIFKKLFQKYALIILNEDSQEEQFSIRLNRINVLVIVSLTSFFIIGCTILAMLYTPIHDYLMPPQKQIEVMDKQEIVNLSNQIEVLEEKLSSNDLYIRNLQTILSGKVPVPKVDTTNGQFNSSIDLSKVDLNPSEEDMKLRKEVEKEEMFNVSGSDSQESGSLLFTPLKGFVTSGYDAKDNHLAIDIAAQQGEAIKSVAAGTVIFSDWTPDTGYVVVIQHAMGMISVYKHAMTVYKKVGDVIKKGEVIAAVGNTGELTTGPHLHFELWIEGNPVDPQQFIVF